MSGLDWRLILGVPAGILVLYLLFSWLHLRRLAQGAAESGGANGKSPGTKDGTDPAVSGGEDYSSVGRKDPLSSGFRARDDEEDEHSFNLSEAKRGEPEETGWLMRPPYFSPPDDSPSPAEDLAGYDRSGRTSSSPPVPELSETAREVQSSQGASRFRWEPPEETGAGVEAGAGAAVPASPDIQVLEHELQASRAEVGELRTEVHVLHQEIEGLRAAMVQLEQKLNQTEVRSSATQGISQFYGDAMQLAQSGLDADQIAGRCGIARAEAELVVSLARTHPSGRSASE